MLSITVVHNVRPAGHIRPATSRHVARHFQKEKIPISQREPSLSLQLHTPLISRQLPDLYQKSKSGKRDNHGINQFDSIYCNLMIITITVENMAT